MYGDSYRGYNAWRIIEWVQSMETQIEGKMYGVSYGGYNVWRLHIKGIMNGASYRR